MIEQERALNNTTYDAGRKKKYTQLFLGWAWAASMVIFAVIQFLLGTDARIILMASLALLFCALPLFLFGIEDINTVFIFALLSKYSFFPLWIKTLLGERIDIGLTSPFNTFAMALAGSVIACAALLFVHFIPIKRRILEFSLTDKQVLVAGYLASIFGLFFLSLFLIFGPRFISLGVLLKGFGGYGSLIGPLYFGIICLTVMSLKSRTNPIHKAALLLILILVFFISIQSNAKLYFTFSVLAFALTFYYFRTKIKFRYLISLGIFVIFYAFIFAPVIHVTRNPAFKLADTSGKITIIGNLFKNYSLSQIIDESNGPYNHFYYPAAGSYLVDRFEMIQDMDIVAGGISRGNTIGWIPLRWAVESSLPSFINPNKPQVMDIDLIAYNAGYFPILSNFYYTIGLFGSAYAMFLWPGLIFISLAILISYLLLLKVIVRPSLRYNLFGIFLLTSYAFNFSEISVEAFMTTIIRSIPLDVVLIFGILLITYFIIPNPHKNIPQSSGL